MLVTFLVNSIVEILSDVQILLGCSFLPTLVGRDFDFIGTEYLTQSSGVIMEEGFAEIVKIILCEIHEHFEFTLLDFFKDILIVE